MPLQSGTTLGPHEIQAPIGAGGMGEVYKATDTRLLGSSGSPSWPDWAGWPQTRAD